MANKPKAVLAVAALVLAQVSLIALVLTQEHTWGGPDLDTAAGVVTAPDNSVYVTGRTLSFGAGDSDAFLLKYAADGSLLWQRTFGTGSTVPGLRADEIAEGVAIAPDGSAIYITGHFGDGSLFVAKFDPDGNLIWQRTWGDNGNFPNGIAVTAEGVYVTGGTSTFGVGQGDAILIKLTPDGALVWDMTWGGSGFDAGRDIAVDAAGDVYVAGDTNSFIANDAFLIKINPAGVLLWERDWGALNRDGFPGLSMAFGVGTAPDGSVYFTGNVFDTGESRNNIILVKFNADGDLVWERIGGPGFGSGNDVAVAPDGELFVSGSVLADLRDPNVFGGFAFVAQFSADGKKRKALLWGGDVNDTASGESIAIGADGTIAVAGFAGSPPYVADSTGNTARAVDAFHEIVTGMTTDPPALLNADPGGIVMTPAGSETFGGGTDAVFLRLQR
jgi:serine-aspartate repeat-containing protein C/D/E